MANSEVSRLKFNNTTYDIADELARQNIGVARSEIATEAARLDAVDTGLAGRITNLENSAGAVLVAKTKSAMSDTSKIYVYTGSESGMTRGNWYYHNGSAWVSGGAYNQNLDAIDATLTQSNKGADAKVTGDRLTAAETDISKLRGTIANEYTSQAYAVGDYCYYNGLLYRCNTAISIGETWTSSHWTAVDVMPELNNLKNDIGILAPQSDAGDFTWTLGKTINVTTGSVTDASFCAVTNRIVTKGGKGGRVYNLCSATGMNNKPTVLNIAFYGADGFISRKNILNGGYQDIPDAATGTNLVFGYLSSSGNVVTQEDINEHFAVRIVSKAIDERDVFDLRPTINVSDLVLADNYSEVLPDCNDIMNNSIYRLNFAVGSADIPLHTPYEESWGSKQVATLISTGVYPDIHRIGDVQIFLGSDGMYLRFFSRTAWEPWSHVANNTQQKVIVVDPDGNGDYTSFTEGVVAGYTQYTDALVYVRRGTYDAIAEAKALYGNDYFDNWETSYGPISLRNNVHVYCEPGTVLESHYTGNNDAVMSYYSPINFKVGKATLEGLTIKASRVRYCIHDDQWRDETPYQHYLKNCRLEMDNRQNTGWDRRQAFGGGFGVNGYVQFDNCYFKAYGLEDASSFTGHSSCSFHNSPAENAQSKVVLNNCYFADESTFRLTYHGTSQLVSEAFLSGCSLGNPIETGPEQSSSAVVNVEVVDCNNVVR